jgi:hypothetical protein
MRGASPQRIRNVMVPVFPLASDSHEDSLMFHFQVVIKNSRNRARQGIR